MVAPFGVLLAAIALAPLFLADWWERHYPKVSLVLGTVVVAYYLFFLGAGRHVWRTTTEYISFICLVGSLFVISGGIHIKVKGEAMPRVNLVFLFVGALTANVLGTIGASMLLIRPWLRMNKYRLTGHHVVFFIFIVSNVGGSLTPVGNPPLFLGYLEGVPFWWAARNCWRMWLIGVGILLGMFFVIDTLNFNRAPRRIRELETAREEWNFLGLTNLLYLALVTGAVFINHPHFVRELIMAAAACGSYFTTQKQVHDANDFNFKPFKEVAILFAAIFATMMPALDWLRANASHLGQPGPALFFWGSGALSSVLDNAPTYLSFLSAELGAFVTPETTAAMVAFVKAHGADLSALASGPHAEQIRQAIEALQMQHPAELAAGAITQQQAQMAAVLGHPLYLKCLTAITIGSVFFGAATYIGNVPNFMVKAIADYQKARTPTFLGYIFKFTLPYLLPMLLVVWWLFFRG